MLDFLVCDAENMRTACYISIWNILEQKYYFIILFDDLLDEVSFKQLANTNREQI